MAKKGIPYGNHKGSYHVYRNTLDDFQGGETGIHTVLPPPRKEVDPHIVFHTEDMQRSIREEVIAVLEKHLADVNAVREEHGKPFLKYRFEEKPRFKFFGGE